MKFVKTQATRIRNLLFTKNGRDLARVQALLDQLDYDFNQFELMHFVGHIENCRRKGIHLLPIECDPALFGIWLSGDEVEYIFYNAFVQPIHQVHIVLHEIGHMLLGHEKRPIKNILPSDMVAEWKLYGMTGRARYAPTDDAHADAEEQETEHFVYLVQQRTMRANRLAELTRESSSIELLRPITDTMGYTQP